MLFVTTLALVSLTGCKTSSVKPEQSETSGYTYFDYLKEREFAINVLTFSAYFRGFSSAGAYICEGARGPDAQGGDEAYKAYRESTFKITCDKSVKQKLGESATNSLSEVTKKLSLETEKPLWWLPIVIDFKSGEGQAARAIDDIHKSDLSPAKDIAHKAWKAKESGDEAGLKIAKEIARDGLSVNYKTLRKAVDKNVSGYNLRAINDFSEIMAKLKAPLADPAFEAGLLPELKDLYKTRLEEIENSIPKGRK